MTKVKSHNHSADIYNVGNRNNMNRENMAKRTGMTGKIGITERNDWDD